MKQIEIEYRARFSKKKHDELVLFLRGHAKDLGQDDKRIWFFVMPDKLVKVTHDVLKKRGKITLKLTKIGRGTHFEEIEFFIEEGAIDSAVALFSGLGYRYLYEPKILRHDFLYKGVEIALKYSKTWGYHTELEILINILKDKKVSDKKIRDVAGELGVDIMTEQELRDFTGNIEKTYKNPKSGG